MKKYAVIVAGGAGTRMQSAVPKQFLLLQGKPVLWYTLSTFLAAFSDVHIICVLPAEYEAMGRSIIADSTDPSRIQLTHGGDTRYQSVKNGLALIKDEAVVFVHDGVRCLVTAALLQLCYQTTLEKGNAVPAIQATDSVRLETADGNTTLERESIRFIQTPQTFLASALQPAYQQPYQPSFTDEATVVEQSGFKIHLVQGETNNIKITRPVDLMIAEMILRERSQLAE